MQPATEPALTRIGKSAIIPRFYSVQILRGLAAVLVVLHHQAQAAEDLFPHPPSLAVLHRGAFGVDIFFPISGFVMFLTASALLARPPRPRDWQHFAWRRFLRVAPTYWGFTLLKLALLVAVPSVLVHFHFLLWNAVAAFLFLPAINALGVPEPPLVVGWTLVYEVFFYLLVTVAIARRLPLLRWCAVVIVPAALLGLVIPHRLGGLTYLADPIELEFLAGMLIALAAARLQRVPRLLAAVTGVAALAFALLHRTLNLEFQPLRVLAWGIPGVLILLAAVALETRVDLSRQRALLLLGDASYALYLTHTFTVPVTRSLARPLHLHGNASVALFLLAGVLACLVVGILFHVWVERPLLTRWTAGARR